MAREMAMQMLFQSDLGATPLPLVVRSFDPLDYVSQLDHELLDESVPTDDESVGPAVPAPKKPAPRSPVPARVVEERAPAAPDDELRDAFEYARRIAEGVHGHLQAIDARIRAQADNWRLERMPSVDRNILRIAIYELEHEVDVPKLVVVDEAVELAKRYGSEQSGRFVNGLLDGILKRGDLGGSLQ
jgi:N utilization substance protein B